MVILLIKLKKDLQRDGYIKTTADNKYQVQKTYNGTNTRMIAFFLEKNNELSEKEVEELKENNVPINDFSYTIPPLEELTK